MRNLLFIMTYGMSLSLWKSIGIFHNEVKRLANLAKAYRRIYLITYDTLSNEVFWVAVANKKLGEICIIPLCKPNAKVNNMVFSLLVPIIYRHVIKTCDIITTQQIFGCWIAIMAKLFFKRSLILRQGYQLSKFALYERRHTFYVIARILEFIAYWLADAIIVTSENDKRYIIKHYHVNASKIYVIPNWVDTSLFKPLPHANKKRGKIIFVGRLEYQKNVRALIEAVKGLTNVELYIIGDGTMRESLERKVKDEGVTNVFFLGIVPHEMLPYELNSSEIFVLPSLWEGHPKALIEAMACGLPVIGSDVEGIREVIVHGFNGLLCKPDPKSIRSAILTLINNSELRRRLGENARRFVVENYSIEKVMRRELALHLWLLKAKSR